MLAIITTIWSDAVLHFYIFSFGVLNVKLSKDPSEGLEDCISFPAQKYFLYSPVSWRGEELENIHFTQRWPQPQRAFLGSGCSAGKAGSILTSQGKAAWCLSSVKPEVCLARLWQQQQQLPGDKHRYHGTVGRTEAGTDLHFCALFSSIYPEIALAALFRAFHQLLVFWGFFYSIFVLPFLRPFYSAS